MATEKLNPLVRVYPETFDGNSVVVQISRRKRRVIAAKHPTDGWIVALGIEGRYVSGTKWWDSAAKCDRGKTKLTISPYDSPKRLRKVRVRFKDNDLN